jgi:CheY-like chemotaxis protein
MSILIVEDNPVSARMLEVTLQKNGYTTVRARTGREALDELREHGTEIEMVITDIMMPEMDGLELFSAVRSNPKWKSLPVVVASAAADAESVSRAVRLGCEDYLLKPINTAQLLEKVRSILVDKMPVLRDRNRVFADLAIEPELYQDLVELFKSQSQTLLGRLAGAPTPESIKRLISEAMELAEGAKLVGAERLTIRLAALGRAQAKGHPDSNDLWALREELKAVLDALAAAEGTAPEPSAPEKSAPAEPTQRQPAAAQQPSAESAQAQKVGPSQGTVSEDLPK